MEKWNIPKKGLRDAYLNEIPEKHWKYLPYCLIESPAGRYAFYAYGEKEPRMMYTIANFLILEYPEKPRIILKSENKEAHCFIFGKTAYWSGDERFVFIDLAITKKEACEHKLIIDIPDSKFTLIPLARSPSYSFSIKRVTGSLILIPRNIPRNN